MFTCSNLYRIIIILFLIYIEIIGGDGGVYDVDCNTIILQLYTDLWGDGEIYDVDCDNGFAVVYWSPNTWSCA